MFPSLSQLVGKQGGEKKFFKKGVKKMRKELTDAMIEKIIELNPDLSDKELKQMIVDKFIIMKTRKVISLKPIEDRFKEKIDKYMSQVKEVRLK